MNNSRKDKLSAITLPDVNKKKKKILIAEYIDTNFIIIITIIEDSFAIIRADNEIEAVEKAKDYL